MLCNPKLLYEVDVLLTEKHFRTAPVDHIFSVGPWGLADRWLGAGAGGINVAEVIVLSP